jgi:hypothetical protein
MSKKTGKYAKIAGRDPTSQLYRAVLRYVTANGGSIVVIGGIQILEWPDSPSGNFSVVVRCTGRKPTYKDAVRSQDA